MILPELTGAKEVAVLVRCLSSIDAAAELIEQYACTVASGARLDANQDANDRMSALLQKFMAPYMGKDEFEEIQARVTQEMAHG